MVGQQTDRVDALVAAVAAVFCLSGAAIVGSEPGDADLTVLPALVLVGQCVPLAFRRRWPLAVWATAGTAAAVYGVADWPDPLFPVGAFLGLATVFECCSRRVAVGAWLVSVVVFVFVSVASGDSDSLDIWMAIVGLLAAPLLGEGQRARTAYVTEVQGRLERAELDRRREVESAQLAERAHLARELHDVVAHHVSMIVVQAEAGAAANPSSSRAFDDIAGSARRALRELRTVLGLLRTESAEVAPTAPQPGLDQVEQLVRSLTVPALQVELTVQGTAQPLPPAVDLSAYRVVQEGLTNVVKHSGAGRARVAIEYRPHDVRVQISDDGRGFSKLDHGDSSGHGLIGLSERVSLLGGSIAAGAMPSGGYLLDVVLPTESM